MAKKSIEEQRKELELQLKELEIAQLQEEVNQARKKLPPKKIEEGDSSRRVGRLGRIKDGIVHLNDYERNEENIKAGKYERGSIIYLLRNILVVITQSIMWVGETFGKSLERFEERLNGGKGDDTQQPLDKDKEE
jgi:hypothetical protein